MSDGGISASGFADLVTQHGWLGAVGAVIVAMILSLLAKTAGVVVAAFRPGLSNDLKELKSMVRSHAAKSEAGRKEIHQKIDMLGQRVATLEGVQIGRTEGVIRTRKGDRRG